MSAKRKLTEEDFRNIAGRIHRIKDEVTAILDVVGGAAGVRAQLVDRLIKLRQGQPMHRVQSELENLLLKHHPDVADWSMFYTRKEDDEFV